MKLILVIDGSGNYCNIILKWMSSVFTGDKPTLI